MFGLKSVCNANYSICLDTPVFLCVFMCVYVYVCMYAFVCIYIYIYVYVYMCVFVCVCVQFRKQYQTRYNKSCLILRVYLERKSHSIYRSEKCCD